MSKEKILKTLEKHPAGLSIGKIAEESSLHRNTVSPAVKELVEDEKVEEKKVGTAKLYYLKKFAGIHEMESSYKGKNIRIGIGVSDLKDGLDAATSAAKQAAMQSSKGKEPTFSLVFVSSRYNDQIEKVVKGMNKILGKDWIGCTSDRELNSILGYSQGTVEVLSIESKYLHFSPILVDNYRENPVKKAEKATEKAVDQANVERSIHATSQYMRSTKKSFSDIIKNPPYFVLAFPGGVYYDKSKALVPGMEVEFLEGINNALGPHIPIIGGSATSDAQELSKRKGENYVFANGIYSNSGAVICFTVSELYFSYGLEHGYEPTDKTAVITKVSGNGRIIEELNRKPAVDEYCKLIEIPKDKFLKNPFKHFTMYPILSFDISQNIYPKTCTLSSQSEDYIEGGFKYREGQSVMIGRYDKEKTVKALKNSIENSLKDKSFEPAISLITTCSVRRMLLQDKVRDAINLLESEYPNLPFFGFYTAGEIGCKRNEQPRHNNITATSLVISDKLQTE